MVWHNLRAQKLYIFFFFYSGWVCFSSSTCISFPSQKSTELKARVVIANFYLALTKGQALILGTVLSTFPDTFLHPLMEWVLPSKLCVVHSPKDLSPKVHSPKWTVGGTYLMKRKAMHFQDVWLSQSILQTSNQLHFLSVPFPPQFSRP